MKPYPKLRVIKSFGTYHVGRILDDVTALYREWLISRGYVELVDPIPRIIAKQVPVFESAQEPEKEQTPIVPQLLGTEVSVDNKKHKGKR